MKNLIQTYSSAGNELVSSIPVTTGQPYKCYTLRSIRIDDIKAGDKFNAFGGFSLTWTKPYMAMAYCFILATDAPLAQPALFNTLIGAMMDPPSGQNIDNQVHHYRSRMQGQWIADQDYDTKYFQFCAYAASTAAVAGDIMTIDLGYGKAWIDQYREALETA